MAPFIRVVLTTATLLLTSIPAHAAIPYRITDLGPGGGTQGGASGINDAGQVVGSTAAPTGTRAFLWTARGGMQNLGDLPGGDDFSVAHAINNAGQVAGSSEITTGTRAFRWTARGGMQDLGVLAEGHVASQALGINSAGQVVGVSRDSDRANHPFLWTVRGGMQELFPVTSPDQGARATGINDAGQVVGWSESFRSFLWSAGAGPVDLGALPGGYSTGANAINNASQVVGGSGPPARAFLWSVGVGMQNLGVLPPARPLGEDDIFEPYSAALAINEAGQVVGFSNELNREEPRAFLWTAAEGMLDLNALIDPLDPLKPVTTLTAASDINNVGQIVGTATIKGLQRAFLLTPVPEPASWALLLAGLGLSGPMLRRWAS